MLLQDIDCLGLQFEAAWILTSRTGKSRVETLCRPDPRLPSSSSCFGHLATMRASMCAGAHARRVDGH